MKKGIVHFLPLLLLTGVVAVTLFSILRNNSVLGENTVNNTITSNYKIAVWVASSENNGQFFDVYKKGAVIKLYDESGKLLARKKTDKIGWANFYKRAGKYKVELVVPRGYRFDFVQYTNPYEFNIPNPNWPGGVQEVRYWIIKKN